MTKIFSIFFLFLLAGNLSVHGKKIVSCYFIFGDSLIDNGNNNDRATVSKANYLPYGIDYPGGPTGRFTNGRNIADFIAEDLGFTEHRPPFANASGDAFVYGVNYASASSGILPGTGNQTGDVISLDKQLQHHEISIRKVISALGNGGAKKHLRHCLYSVGMGSNDYFSYSLSAVKPTPEQYASQLIAEYSRQLRSLHKLGARKVAVFGLGTVGCVPASLRGSRYGEPCLSITRATTGVFNAEIKSLVDVLNKDLVGAKFTYIDVFGIVVSDPSASGFEFQSQPCCKLGATGLCVPNSPVCNDRRRYAFFDDFHPTEALDMVVARRAFAALSPTDAYPFDIKTLVMMKLE